MHIPLKNSSRGFTLMELMIVVALISLLTIGGYAAYSESLKTARDSRRREALKEIATALELYNARNGSYPTTNGAWYSHCAWPGWTGNSKVYTGANGWIPDLAPSFIRELPREPKRGTQYDAVITHDPSGTHAMYTYCFIYRSDGVEYKVASHCGVEGKPVASGDDFYKGNMGWGCDVGGTKSYSYAIYTDGAASW